MRVVQPTLVNLLYLNDMQFRYVVSCPGQDQVRSVDVPDYELELCNSPESVSALLCHYASADFEQNFYWSFPDSSIDPIWQQVREGAFKQASIFD